MDQGVGQRKLLSTRCYKAIINDLLNRLDDASQGYCIGNTYIGAPTCADDIILIARNPIELQSQLNTVADYAKQEHYQINPMKSQYITYRVYHPTLPSLNGADIPLATKLTHLGIDRYPDEVTDRGPNVSEQKDSVCPDGHRLPWLQRHITLQIYRAYVLPRMLYGLEAVTLGKSQISELEQCHRNTVAIATPTNCHLPGFLH